MVHLKFFQTLCANFFQSGRNCKLNKPSYTLRKKQKKYRLPWKGDANSVDSFQNEKIVKRIISKNKDLMQILRIIKLLDLKQGVLAAGSIRNTVWQVLSGQQVSLENDVDLVYYDPSKPQNYDFFIESQLRENYPEYNWQVKNEVYMHDYDFKKENPFVSVEDAIAHFVETPTCIGAYLNTNEILKLIIPYGVDDLVNFTCRPVPAFREDQQHLDIFKNRIRCKKWIKKYPQLKVIV